MQLYEKFAENLWRSEKFLVEFRRRSWYNLSNFKALTNTGKRVGIIHLDAHYDNVPNYENEQFAHQYTFHRDFMKLKVFVMKALFMQEYTVQETSLKQESLLKKMAQLRLQSMIYVKLTIYANSLKIYICKQVMM